MDSTGPLGFLRSLLPFNAAQGTPASTAGPENDQLPQQVASRCIACGVCDWTFDAYDRVSRAEFRGPMAFVLGFASQTDVAGLGAQVHELKKGNLLELERRCPVRIPFPLLAEVLGEQAGPDSLPRNTVRPRPRHDPG